MRNLWTIPIDHKERVGDHPTQKPLEWVQRCLTIASDPGDWVLDPFVGSGTTLLVAKRLGRNCVGIDKNPLWLKDIKAKTGWNETTLTERRISYRVIGEGKKPSGDVSGRGLDVKVESEGSGWLSA